MLHNIDKELVGDKVILAMDDGGRCLLDVIDDPQLLQSFLENTNGAIERLESGVNQSIENQHKTIVKAIDPNNSANQLQISKIAANISLISDSKQVDQVTSSGGNSSPVLSLNKATSGPLIIDEKQTLNMVSSSVGLIPMSALSSVMTAGSISIAQSPLTTLTNTTPVGQITSTVPLRGPIPSTWPPTSFQIAAPRNAGAVTVQLPQQLIVPAGMQMATNGGLSQLVLRPGGPHGPQLPPGIQPGQLVQIIQTPSGPQILPTNASATVQPIVSTNSLAKSSSTTSSSRSNKQILPKPPGTTGTASNVLTTNSANKCGQLSQQNTLKVINSLPTNTTQFTSTSIPTSGAGPQTQQILIGPGGQPAGVIASGPNGTFLLNHMIQGIGGQPFLIQGNLGNVPNSVQLTLRPQSHTSPVVAMSNGMTNQNISLSEQNGGILSAFTGQSTGVAKQTPSQSPQPQTYVIPNSTSLSTGTSGMVMTNAGRNGPNIFLARPPFLGAPHPGQQPMSTGQQFLQLQTPNGPILVALQTQPQLLQQSAPTQPTHGIQLGNTMIPIGAQHLSSHLGSNMGTSIQTAAHPALHALLTQNDNTNQTVIQTSVPSVVTSNTVILTSQPQIITRPQLQQQSQSQQLKHSAPSVNLAELLKEHGILPESSPPSSPTNNSMTDLSTGAVHSELLHQTPTGQQTVLMVPNGPNQPPNIVLTHNPMTPTAPPQLRLALGPDGSVILHPQFQTNSNQLISQQIQSQFISNSNNLKYNDSLKDSSGLGSSQPSPDSTTPSIDSTSTISTNSSVSQTTTTTTSTAPSMTGQNTSALLEQLNTGPAVKVPDLVASLALSNGSSAAITTSEESKPIQSVPSLTSQTALIPLTVQNINNSLEQQKQTILTFPVQSGDSAVPNVSNGSSSAVIRIGSCDTIPTSLVLTTTPTTVLTSPAKGHNSGHSLTTVLSPNHCTNANNSSAGSGNTTTVIDQNGVPMIQVSPNNQEFLQRLENQLKNLLALKSPSNQQKELLQELMSLQQKMNLARHHKHNTGAALSAGVGSEDQKLVLTTASTLNISPQTQQVLQSTPQPMPTSAQSQSHPNLQNQSQAEAQPQQQTPQNVHLVNLLKQTPVNQTSGPQIRLLTPTSSAPVTATATIQVGNQLITFTTPAKQQLQNLKSIATNQTHQTLVKPQIASPTPAVILRLHTPTPTTTSTLVTTSTATKTSIIRTDSHSDKERRNAKILKAIQQQLNVDQNAALKPDTKRAFSSRDDACKRLLRYHVFNSPTMTTKDMEKSDQLFETVSKHLLHKKQQLFDKFRVLLLKQSMKETMSSEHVMIDRMFINEETNSLKADREAVAEGKALNLPPAPDSWYQMLRSTLEEEEQKLFINRKRKSSIGSDDEYNCQTNQLRRHEEPVDDTDESEDDDEDSDDEETEEKEESMSGFLQSVPEPNLGNVGHYYDNFQHNLHLHNGSRLDGQSHVPLNGYVGATQPHELGMYSDMNEDNGPEDWTDSILNNSSANRRIAWNPRFGVPESEAAVAVESILNTDEEDEPDMSVDLSGIEGLDDNLDEDNEEDDDEDGEDDDEDDDDEEEEGNGYDMGSQHVDVQHQQMQCAIKSILDMPSVQSQSHQNHNNSYAFHSHSTHSSHGSHSSHPSLHPHLSDFRNIDYSNIPNLHDHRRTDAILRNYSAGHSAGVNDPILDEAVKSILS